MKRLIFFCAAIAAVLPTFSHATALDEGLYCDRTAHEFIGPLERDGLIDPKPSRVEPNSINAFNPASGAQLTAFGFHTFKIVAFQQDDPMFRKGDGKPIAKSAYGAVVIGSRAKVQAAVDAAQSPAIVHEVAPFITAIFCQQD
jgi:hypothetical protein